MGSQASRTARTAPARVLTPPRLRIVERILKIHKKREWGAREIRKPLADDPSIDPVPSTDTIGRIVRRHGCIERANRAVLTPIPVFPVPPEPNATRTADFKGKFQTQDRKLCFPLTMYNRHSRFLLACRGMLHLDLKATLRRFRYRSSGSTACPGGIRTDNGHPFTAITGLSQLSVWWISLSILPELIESGKPSRTAATNGWRV